MNNSTTTLRDTKKLFLKKGSCSQALFYILNREFGHTRETAERASDTLAGGIVLEGHQCGLLWGATLGLGAESFRRYDDRGQAIAIAITASQRLVESFSRRAGSVNCLGITNCDWSSKLSMAKYFFSGRVFRCFSLADKWAPEAIQSAIDGLELVSTHLPRPPMNCAIEVARKKGASDEEMGMVAGFAGGLGLSGNACGALAAAIWMNTLSWCKDHPGKAAQFFNNPEAKRPFEAFHSVTGSEILCHEVSGQRFETIDEHTEFLRSGGCDKLIDVLARS